MDFVSDALMGGTTYPNFGNCRRVGSFKPCARSGYVVYLESSSAFVEKLRLQGRLPQRIKVDDGPEFSGNALDGLFVR